MFYIVVFVLLFWYWLSSLVLTPFHISGIFHLFARIGQNRRTQIKFRAESSEITLQFVRIFCFFFGFLSCNINRFETRLNKVGLRFVFYESVTHKQHVCTIGGQYSMHGKCGELHHIARTGTPSYPQR